MELIALALLLLLGMASAALGRWTPLTALTIGVGLGVLPAMSSAWIMAENYGDHVAIVTAGCIGLLIGIAVAALGASFGRTRRRIFEGIS